jgi:predicted dehydrogenase
MNSRRKFLNQSSLLAGSIMFGSLPAYSLFKNSKTSLSPSDNLNFGAIGINGMGWADTMAAMKIPGINLVAMADIDQNVLDRRMTELSKMNLNTRAIDQYKDYRKILDRKDIDFVIIGTPDHWHALIMMHAVEAGKDVYVEKPVGNSIGECMAMVAAQKKYNKAVQAGQWQRSQQHFKDAVDFVQSGQLGNIRMVKVWCYQGWMKPGPKVPDTPPPAGIDFKTWLGPAPDRTFNSSRFHFNFRWFWDYAGGLMTDWGVHLIDYGLIGMKASLPKSISALGGRFAYPELLEETPDTLTTLYEFDGFNMVWDSAMGIDNGSYNRDHGIAYIGNNGTLILNRGGWEVIEEKGNKLHKVSKPFSPSVDDGLKNHMENFVQVVRSRKMEDLHCPIEAGAHIATVSQMGNIAYRTGKKLEWDSQSHRFTDGSVNDAYLIKTYHNGYSLPKV